MYSGAANAVFGFWGRCCLSPFDNYGTVVLPPFETVGWSENGRALRLLDQRRLPTEELYIDVASVDELIEAIRTLAVRGAPAIGVAAAMGLAVLTTGQSSVEHIAELCDRIALARPTAVNLRWALNRMLARAQHTAPSELAQAMRDEATWIRDNDREMCDAIGKFGAPLIKVGSQILTHCNAGALATAGIGTALAPMYVAHAQGTCFRVFADETRPLLQGARLTAWELQRAGIDVRVLPDSAAASLLASGNISAVFVGADRIAANGDVANKVGTYAVALAAQAHGVPLYVCAPSSTFDHNTARGADIVIEHRERNEIALAGTVRVLPERVGVHNPAFDVTPAALVTNYITDRGLLDKAVFV